MDDRAVPPEHETGQTVPMHTPPTRTPPTQTPPTRTPGARIAPEHVVDVFVYVVVLNLAAQYAPAVIAETFALSLLAALLLKLVLEVVLVLKGRARRRLATAPTTAGRVLGALTLAVLLPGSKIVVLELFAWVFGDAVQLGGFFLVTALILVLLAARLAVRRLLFPPPPQRKRRPSSER
ncbi:hypothetical protein [Cellulomonas gelida]|uniref:Uncharacterized protein n=1 Tax=Cellulomonas gelida TaxID=1712 RepID=A0A4Y3KRX3_9CELL|nr:hypothetical protein [Cellulomonas gelida]GEA85680.1 hypothetical protein CGE01nite_29310 [Cellulomonas gelida]GGL21436.1 hypothetical protein GCM10009774_09700 [Cellulomonas gelida]